MIIINYRLKINIKNEELIFYDKPKIYFTPIADIVNDLASWKLLCLLLSNIEINLINRYINNLAFG